MARGARTCKDYALLLLCPTIISLKLRGSKISGREEGKKETEEHVRMCLHWTVNGTICRKLRQFVRFYESYEANIYDLWEFQRLSALAVGCARSHGSLRWGVRAPCKADGTPDTEIPDAEPPLISISLATYTQTLPSRARLCLLRVWCDGVADC